MPAAKLSSLSIFFPAYNEAANIEHTLLDALTYAPSVTDKFEIIVVNDGSADQTGEIVRKLSQKHHQIKLVNHPHNRGYGGAVKTGVKAASYEYTFFTDSDRQFHFSELPKFVSLHGKADVIVGYRRKRQDPLLRIIIAQYMLKYWNFMLFGLWMKDVDCAYKLIPTRYLRRLKLITDSAITVTEIMVKLKGQGLSIYETPVTHYSRRHGTQTGSNPKVILKAFRESFKLWKELKHRP